MWKIRGICNTKMVLLYDVDGTDNKTMFLQYYVNGPGEKCPPKILGRMCLKRIISYNIV